MSNTVQRKGSLIGRVFLIADVQSIKNWSGNNGDDYESLDDTNFGEEAGTSFFKKSGQFEFISFFTMSTKVEIFIENERDIIVCEGLYFDESVDGVIGVEVLELDDLDMQLNIISQRVIVAVATEDCTQIDFGDNYAKDVVDSIGELSSLSVSNGIYFVRSVEINAVKDDQPITLKGIRLYMKK